MIQIAICDDEKNIRTYLSALIQAQNIECEITEYASGEAFLSVQTDYDLLLLDIDLQSEISGMSLAKWIRSREKEKQPIIIFVTGYKEYVFDAFDVSAFHYLIKPISKEKFGEVFGKAVQQINADINQKKKTLTIQYANTNKSVPLEEIYYIESQNHKVILHTKSGTLEYYAKISDLETELKNQFFRIHKGYLINLAFIDKYNKTDVTLVNQEKLPLSKYKYSDFVKAYLRFME